MSGTVVVVEDDPAILTLLADILGADGVEMAGVDAPDVERIRRAADQPSVFLLDLMLAGTNGIDLARVLQRLYPHTPCIAMSASRLMLDAARDSGLFRQVIAKPFNLSTVLDAVGQLALEVEVTP